MNKRTEKEKAILNIYILLAISLLIILLLGIFFSGFIYFVGTNI